MPCQALAHFAFLCTSAYPPLIPLAGTPGKFLRTPRPISFARTPPQRRHPNHRFERRRRGVCIGPLGDEVLHPLPTRRVHPHVVGIPRSRAIGRHWPGSRVRGHWRLRRGPRANRHPPQGKVVGEDADQEQAKEEELPRGVSRSCHSSVESMRQNSPTP